VKIPSNGRLSSKLLLSAFACHPNKGSEPGVGWAFLVAALEVCDQVHLLTRSDSLHEIQEALTSDQRDRCVIHGVVLPRNSNKLADSIPCGHQIFYLEWQRRAKNIIANLHAVHNFSIVHHVTYANDWMPVRLARSIDVPFVWGPIGGATSTPSRLLAYQGPRGVIAEVVRKVATNFARFTFARSTANAASLIVAANEDVVRSFARYSGKVVTEPNAAITLPIGPPSARSPSFDIVGAGRLVSWKGWALALEAISTIDKRYTFHLFGDGPDRTRLERRSRRLGIDDRVYFHGNVSRERLLHNVSEAHAFLFPSFHDTSPWAVAEALTLGCPVVCLDLGGPKELLRRGGGSVVPYRGRHVANRLGAALMNPVPPFDRSAWHADRLPTILRSWYQQCLGPTSDKEPSHQAV
jgi:glycosyltransferase involved in cell wall biosynthesis